MEIGQVRSDEREFEAARETSMEKDNSNGLLFIQRGK